HLNYAANNGRPYTSIGKILIDEGKLPAGEMSAALLRRYLTDHPEAREGLLPRNERYVFFRFLKGGPFGSLGVPVTPGRSIAVDPDYFPKGMLGFLESRMPVVDAAGSLAGWRPFSRFVLAQDAGGAIRGPTRVDLYFGGGEEAGKPAGFMKSGGRLYLLSEKNSTR
ncbi:MAG TPA: MltA domain-containing protein, partial [Candidatus Binatia bacterium]